MTGLLLCALLTPYYEVDTILEKWLESDVSFPGKRISSFNDCCFMKKSAHDSLFQSMYNNSVKQQYIGSNCFWRPTLAANKIIFPTSFWKLCFHKLKTKLYLIYLLTNCLISTDIKMNFSLVKAVRFISNYNVGSINLSHIGQVFMFQNNSITIDMMWCSLSPELVSFMRKT